MVEIAWIGCRESYVMRAILKMMRLWIGSRCNLFRQSVLLRMGLRRTRCKEWIRGRCTIEKGNAVIQARENKTACKGSCVDGEEWTDVTPRSVSCFDWFNTCPPNSYFTILFLLPMFMTDHLFTLNSICHSCDHLYNLFKSVRNSSTSSFLLTLLLIFCVICEFRYFRS